MIEPIGVCVVNEREALPALKESDSIRLKSISGKERIDPWSSLYPAA
ncbi:hypothetical protein CHCC14427_4401 [Bacillus paralicheniformis]|nr:hypothetical protein CHCC14427_4401 [Bacillus paralicheniformis]